ncbi:MAG: SIMPL domain-containing protein, partial [Sphingomicrobium sp.]
MRSLCLLPLAALAACQPAVPDPRGVDHDETLLTVSATGRSETRPDEASLTIGVNSQGATAAEASTLNNEKMSKVAAALAGFGIKQDDMQTSNLSLGRIDYGRERGRFQASNNVIIRLRDTARVGEAVAAATDAGANLLSGPNL